MSRWTPRLLVILTALLCLGVGGYAGQVWWARRIAKLAADTPDPQYVFPVPFLLCFTGPRDPRSKQPHVAYLRQHIESWAAAPRTGRWCGRWVPRRAYWEYLKRITGRDLPDDPAVWEAWLETQPNLVWDEKQVRFVEGKK